MAHTFEHTLDAWATNGTKSAPSSTLKSTGFVGGMKPPASVFNYQWDKIAKAINELQQYALTEDPSGGIWQNLAAVATSGNYADLTGAPTGFSVYNITTASYTNNKYLIPLTYSRYIYFLNGSLKSINANYDDIPSCVSWGCINKNDAMILSYHLKETDSNQDWYGETILDYGNYASHQSSYFPIGDATAASISENNLSFGSRDYTFIGTVYLMPF